MSDLIKYFSLDEAREEIKKRWGDDGLKKKIETELGDNFIPYFNTIKPRSILARNIASPDNGLMFFYQESKYLDTIPAVTEYLDDIFVSLNIEKKGYGRLRMGNLNLDIIDFHANEKKMIKDVNLITGENLVDFHHNLIKYAGVEVDQMDTSSWFKKIGGSRDYYYPFLLHFVAHGILFESFVNDLFDEKEMEYTKTVIIPTIDRIKNKFGLEPIIVKMYPDGQSDEEDLYWWSYPAYINKEIVRYADAHHLKFKSKSN